MVEHDLVLAWAEIRERYPDRWVCLLDIAYEHDGSIGAAHVIAHDPSIAALLDEIGSSYRDATLAHTSGRPLTTPRIEIVDESRDALRACR